MIGIHLFCVAIVDLVLGLHMQLCRISDIHDMSVWSLLWVVSAWVSSTFFGSLSLLNSLPCVTSGTVPSQPFFLKTMFFLVWIWNNHQWSFCDIRINLICSSWSLVLFWSCWRLDLIQTMTGVLVSSLQVEYLSSLWSVVSRSFSFVL